MGVENKSKTPFLTQLLLSKAERESRGQLSDRTLACLLQGPGFKPQLEQWTRKPNGAPKANRQALTADPRVIFLISNLAFSLQGQGSSLFWSIVLFCYFLKRKLPYFLALTTNRRQHFDGAPCRWALHCVIDNSSHDSDMISRVQDVARDKRLGFRIPSSNPKWVYDHKQVHEPLCDSISWSVKGAIDIP